MVYLRLPTIGASAVYCAYAEASTNLGELNTRLIKDMLKHVATHKRPWLIVGNLNMDSSLVQAAAWCTAMGCGTVEPRYTMCHTAAGTHTHRGYMIVSKDSALVFTKA